MFRQFFLAVILSIIGLTASAQDPKTYYNISDDGYAIVPIPFGFPYFGRVFTHSIFFDNGLVSFYDPVTEGMRLGGQNFNAQPLSDNIGSNFHYSIMPLWSDLRNYSGSYYTQTDSQSYLRYNWENISQYGYPDRLNSFDLEIRPTGFIGINYTKINIGGYPITAGIVGNAQIGEWNQQYYKPPQDTATLSSIQNWSTYTQGVDCSNPLNNQSCPGYQQAFFDQQCNANPLYSSTCPGYQSAFLTQQCSANTLYSTSCPGYAVAYYDYQCSASALYHTGCPGYETAYFDQQCSLNALYNESCSGYSTAYFDQQCGLDPLYDQKCTGYDDAYYVQQCTASPLYDSGCTGYDVAYFDQQCSLNTLYNDQCPGYETAYFNQQCSIDSLYNNQCPGYAAAYLSQQCGINSLYDSSCPGYETAYFNQQCSLDALYNNQCIGYAEAYAKKNIFATKAEPEQEAVKVSVVTPIEVAQVVVIEREQTPTASVSPADVTAAVQLVAPAPATTSPTSKAETSNATSASASSSTTTASAASAAEKKDAPKTTRQALAERRLEAARAKAVEQGAKVADQMDSATTMEQQVEAQGVVLSAMGFVPGFDAYGKSFIPDGVGYKPFTIYSNQTNVDNARMMRGLSGASDRLHDQMTDSQYNRSLP